MPLAPDAQIPSVSFGVDGNLHGPVTDFRTSEPAHSTPAETPDALKQLRREIRKQRVKKVYPLPILLGLFILGVVVGVFARAWF